MDRRRKLAVANTVLLMTMHWTRFLLGVCSVVESIDQHNGESYSSGSFDELPDGALLLLLSNPLFSDLLKVRSKKRFWSAPRGAGVWETQFLGTFRLVGMEFGDQYQAHFRLHKDACWRLHRKYGHLLERQTTHLRLPVPSEKRLAITLHYLAHGLSFGQLSLMYGIGHTTAVNIVHDAIEKLDEHFVKNAIRFPSGQELDMVINDFENLPGGGLPQCAGAVDGTFMRVRKPFLFGDSYWCYKQYTAILILACVDARGIFTYVSAGSPGSSGDAAVYNQSRLAKKTQKRRWLGTSTKNIDGNIIKPYLVGDSAFARSSTMVKCYDHEQGAAQANFNGRLVHTRRVVEQAFGRLKGRFRVLVQNDIYDPDFASKLALVSCALHNVCERWSCPWEEKWEVDKNFMLSTTVPRKMPRTTTKLMVQALFCANVLPPLCNNFLPSEQYVTTA